MRSAGNTNKALLILAILATTAASPALAQQAPYDAFTGTIAAAQSPVMIIRFNEKNVYFQNPLRRVVGKIDASKPSANYNLESVVPGNATRNNANDKDFDENLKSVVTVLNRLGVPIENIAVNTTVSNTVENQEIRLFIK